MVNMKGSAALLLTLSLASAAPLPLNGLPATPGSALTLRSPAPVDSEATTSANVATDDKHHHYCEYRLETRDSDDKHHRCTYPYGYYGLNTQKAASDAHTPASSDDEEKPSTPVQVREPHHDHDDDNDCEDDDNDHHRRSPSLFRRALNFLFGRDDTAAPAKGVSNLFRWGYPYYGYPYGAYGGSNSNGNCKNSKRHQRRALTLEKRIFPGLWSFITGAPVDPNGVPVPTLDKRSSNEKRGLGDDGGWSGEDGMQGAGSAISSASGSAGLDPSISSSNPGEGPTYTTGSESSSGGITVITRDLSGEEA